jgi:hypothetical protein
VGNPFYPQDTKTPDSSNPLTLYSQIYRGWYQADAYNPKLSDLRARLGKGVDNNQSILPPNLSTKLYYICEHIDIMFFYPFVYRVDIEKIDAVRLTRNNSGLLGSSEYLIKDLQEHEFDILFWDAWADPAIKELGSKQITSAQALNILESRCT